MIITISLGIIEASSNIYCSVTKKKIGHLFDSKLGEQASKMSIIKGYT